MEEMKRQQRWQWWMRERESGRASRQRQRYTDDVISHWHRGNERVIRHLIFFIFSTSLPFLFLFQSQHIGINDNLGYISLSLSLPPPRCSSLLHFYTPLLFYIVFSLLFLLLLFLCYHTAVWWVVTGISPPLPPPCLCPPV